MKAFVIALAALCLSSSLIAAPVGNTAAPQLIEEGFFMNPEIWVDFRIGYEGDFVGDARLKQYGVGSGRVDNFQQYTNAASVTLNILDRLDLYGIFGSSRVCADWRIQVDGAIERIEMETLYHYLWALGGRGILFEWGKTALGCGGRYSYCNYPTAWLTVDAIPYGVNGTYTRWRQWQVDLDISYRIDLFTPYLGLKYSSTHARLGKFPVAISSSGSTRDSFETKTPVGLFIGCSLSTGKYFMLNIEGRLIDEDAVTISGDLRF
jgi:hypothetical protein